MSALARVGVRRVSKEDVPVRALADVTLEARSGQVVAVMGPNGAGKSTLLGILALVMRPTRGDVLFDGGAVRAAEPAVRRRIGLLSHQPLVYPDLTGRENLELFARLYGVDGPSAAVARLAERLGLGRFFFDRPARVLSRGQLQRVALARALVHEPALLLLDEPAAGLDAAAIERIAGAVGEHAERGGITVVVTHEPELAARIATRAVMLRGARVVSDGDAPDAADGWRRLYAGAVEGES